MERCIAHLVNTREVSEERSLFEPSRRMGRGERVERDERVVNLSKYELSAVNSSDRVYINAEPHKYMYMYTYMFTKCSDNLY